MRTNNIIDMTSYFCSVQKLSAPIQKKPSLAEKCFDILGRILETSAAVLTALCVCVCTLLFFTML